MTWWGTPITPLLFMKCSLPLYEISPLDGNTVMRYSLFVVWTVVTVVSPLYLVFPLLEIVGERLGGDYEAQVL